MDQDIKTLASRQIYKNRWMRLREDQIQRRDGSKGIYSVVEKPHFVVILPLEQKQGQEDQVHLVEQLRYPVSRRFWELPQGAWEGEWSSNPLEVAHGELAEETGLRADSMVKAGFLYPGYGYSTQGFHIFLAKGLNPGPVNRDHEEQDLIAKAFPKTQVEEMIRDGTIQDATTVAAWGLLKLKGLL